MNRRKLLVFAGLALLVLLLGRVGGWGHAFTDSARLQRLQALSQQHLLAASLLYLAFTAAACVLLALPGITFAVVAGGLFGPWLGSFLCLLGTTAGALLSFLVGRYFLKDAVKQLIMKNTHLKKLLFGEKRENGLVLLMITRLVPVFPFNLQNFAYGITDIGVVKYTLFTFVFMIPGVLFFTLTTAGILAQDRGGLLWAAAGAAIALAGIGGWARRLYKKRYS